MMTVGGSIKIVNSITPRAKVFVLGRGHILVSHIVKMHYFFEMFLIYSMARFIQTKYIVIMNMKGSTKNVDFYDTRGWGLLY